MTARIYLTCDACGVRFPEAGGEPAYSLWLMAVRAGWRHLATGEDRCHGCYVAEGRAPPGPVLALGAQEVDSSDG